LSPPLLLHCLLLLSSIFHLFFSITPPPPNSTLFPYTTLFRSPQNRYTSHQILSPRSLRSRTSLRTVCDGRTTHPHRRVAPAQQPDRKSTRLNSSHLGISYAVFCLKKKKTNNNKTDKNKQKKST